MVFVCRPQRDPEKPRPPRVTSSPPKPPPCDDFYATLCFHPAYDHLRLEDKASLFVFPPTPNASECKIKSLAEDTRHRKKLKNLQVRRVKSNELRGGAIYRGCDCEKRNGLQDNCLRSECQGSPECLARPGPVCKPSDVSYGRHLGTNFYGSISERPPQKVTNMKVKYDETSVTNAANDRGYFIVYKN